MQKKQLQKWNFLKILHFIRHEFQMRSYRRLWFGQSMPTCDLHRALFVNKHVNLKNAACFWRISLIYHTILRLFDGKNSMKNSTDLVPTKLWKSTDFTTKIQFSKLPCWHLCMCWPWTESQMSHLLVPVAQFSRS